MNFNIDNILQETFLFEKDQNIANFYERAGNQIWREKEIDFSTDYQDFIEIDNESQQFILKINIFFLVSDKLVGDNALHYFAKNADSMSEIGFYTEQANMEVIHNKTYSKIFDILTHNSSNILQLEKFEHYVQMIQNFKSIQLKRNFVQKWQNTKDIDHLCILIAFATIECIFFSTSFAGILWFKKRGLLKGITKANELILRDEDLHWQFAAYKINKIIHTLDNEMKQSLIQIVQEGLEIEKEFIKELLPNDLNEMTQNKMINYAEYMTNQLLESCGLIIENKISNPFDFMNINKLVPKQNFFEGTSTSYSKKQCGTFFHYKNVFKSE